MISSETKSPEKEKKLNISCSDHNVNNCQNKREKKKKKKKKRKKKEREKESEKEKERERERKKERKEKKKERNEECTTIHDGLCFLSNFCSSTNRLTEDVSSC
jgi:hypothetical protein